MIAVGCLLIFCATVVIGWLAVWAAWRFVLAPTL
jgi:hypothetical protein